jgi:hypothetical protein
MTAILERQLANEFAEARTPKPVPASNWTASRRPSGILSFLKKASENRNPRGREPGPVTLVIVSPSSANPPCCVAGAWLR